MKYCVLDEHILFGHNASLGGLRGALQRLRPRVLHVDGITGIRAINNKVTVVVRATNNNLTARVGLWIRSC